MVILSLTNHQVKLYTEQDITKVFQYKKVKIKDMLGLVC